MKDFSIYKILLLFLLIVTPQGCSLSDGDIIELSEDERLPVDDARLWLRASAGVYINSSGSVYYWEDRSGNRLDAIGFGTPELADAQLNGLPIIRFSGDDYMKLPEFLDSGDITIFLVLRCTGAITDRYRYFFDYGEIVQKHIHVTKSSNDTSDTFYVQSSDTDKITTTGSGNSFIFHITTARLEGNEAVLYYNGIHDGTGIQTGTYNVSTTWAYDGLPDGTSSPTIGARDSSPVDKMTGDIAEIIIYTRALSSEERESVEAYLKNRYGL